MNSRARPRLRVLATGFGPFPGVTQNASASVVRALAAVRRTAGHRAFRRGDPGRVGAGEGRRAGGHRQDEAARRSAFRGHKARGRFRDRDPRLQHVRPEAGSVRDRTARQAARALRSAHPECDAAARRPFEGPQAGRLSSAAFKKCRPLPLQRGVLLELGGGQCQRRAHELRPSAGDWNGRRPAAPLDTRRGHRRGACSRSRQRSGCAIREA